MSLTVTPGQLNQRAEFYHQLSQLTAAGIGLLQALGQLKRNPPARSYREPTGCRNLIFRSLKPVNEVGASKPVSGCSPSITPIRPG
jgi:type II secretory pathway component PulF